MFGIFFGLIFLWESFFFKLSFSFGKCEYEDIKMTKKICHSHNPTGHEPAS